MLFKTSKFFLHAAVFAVVMVTTTTLFPFIVGKYAWFRGSVWLGFIFFLAGLAFSPEGKVYLTTLKERLRSPVVMAVTAFVLFFVLACFFGARPSFSFWSNFERGEGGFQILSLYIFFVLLITLFRKEEDWRKMFWFSMGAAFLMILYGVLAAFGGSIGLWGSIGPRFGSENFRFQGSLGNSEYVPGYLTFMLFFASYLLLGAKRIRRPQAIGIGALMILFVAFCIMSGTRGAFLGLICGALAAAAYAGFYRKSWRKWLLVAAVLAVLAVAVLVQFRHVAVLQSIPGVSSILRLRFNPTDLADLHTRFVMWDTAFQGWKEKPLFGWGPENFLLLFDKHYEIRYYVPAEGFGAWFDRAHSTLFDYLAQTGILGLLGYLSVFVCLFLLFLRKRWHAAAKSDPRRMLVQALFLGILVTYLVQGTVLFDVFPLYLPLFTLFAFAVYYFQPEGAEGKPDSKALHAKSAPGSNPFLLGACMAGMGLSVAAIYLGAFLPFVKAQKFIEAERQVQFVRSVEEYQQNFDKVYNFYSPVGTEEINKFLGGEVLSIVSSGQPEDVSRKLVGYMEGHLFKDEIRHLLLLGQMYQTLWQKYGQETDYQKAVGYVERAHEIGPNLPPPLYALLGMYRLHGDQQNYARIGRIILANWPQETQVGALPQ